MIVKILTEGGEMKPGPVLSQKLGPAGINIGEVIQKVNEATKNFQGLKVPVEIDVDLGTKDFEVKVFSPPVSELLKREIGITKGSGVQKKIYVANASIEQVISVSKTKFPNMLSKSLKSAVKTIVGTCGSLGILIENKTPIEIQEEINQGKYDSEITKEKTETSAEKKAKLDAYFSKVKAEQEKIIQQEQAAKEAAEAEKTTEAAGTATTATEEKAPAKTEEKASVKTPAKEEKKPGKSKK